MLLAESSSKIDYDSFQLTELQALDLDNIDYEAMKQELSKFENADELLKTISKLKPSTTKGIYVKSVFMSSTMSPSISIDAKLG